MREWSELEVILKFIQFQTPCQLYFENMISVNGLLLMTYLMSYTCDKGSV